MSRILDNTFITEAEGCCEQSKIAELIGSAINKLEFDTYRHEYVVRITVDEVDN